MCKKHLFPVSVFLLLAYAGMTHATMINISGTMTTKEENTFTVNESNEYEEWTSNVSEIEPVAFSIDYGVNLFGGLDFDVFEDEHVIFRSLYLPLESSVPTGPFYSELMSLVNMAHYDYFFEWGEFAARSTQLKAPDSDAIGYEGIQISYQYSGQRNVIQDDIETIYSFSYFSSVVMQLPEIYSLDDFRLSSIGDVQSALQNAGDDWFQFREELSISTSRYKFSDDSYDFLQSKGERTKISGLAQLEVTSVSEPGTLIMGLFGIVWFLIRRSQSQI